MIEMRKRSWQYVMRGSSLSVRILFAALAFIGTLTAQCTQSIDLEGSGALSLGVRFQTRQPDVLHQTIRALQFWTHVLDMRWHIEDSNRCAVLITDGNLGFDKDQVAGAFAFGQIRFSPSWKLSKKDFFEIAAHELGHLFGLGHSRNPVSLMFAYENDEKRLYLDNEDLAVLSRKHKLRSIPVL